MQPLESEIVRSESMNLQMLQTVQIEPEYYVIIQNPIHKIALNSCIFNIAPKPFMPGGCMYFL